ncbi:MAG: PDDEXK nuclease domain-containing protein [Candidatus Saccharimonadales bacterium]
MIIQCPHCRSRCQARDEFAGQQVRCPTCRRVIAVPPNHLAGATPSFADLLEPSALRLPPDQPTPRKKKARRKKDSSGVVVVVLVGSGLLKHVEKFLVELGVGLAFVGRQAPVQVGDDDFHIDLLFYPLKRK